MLVGCRERGSIRRDSFDNHLCSTSIPVRTVKGQTVQAHNCIGDKEKEDQGAHCDIRRQGRLYRVRTKGFETQSLFKSLDGLDLDHDDRDSTAFRLS